jgi:hypothetical protein
MTSIVVVSIELVYIISAQLILFCVLYKKRKIGQNVSKSQTGTHSAQTKIKISASVEHKLVLSTLFIGIAMMMKLLFYTLLLFAIGPQSLSLLLFATDSFSIINPILLIVSSEFTRNMLRQFVCGKKFSV